MSLPWSESVVERFPTLPISSVGWKIIGILGKTAPESKRNGKKIKKRRGINEKERSLNFKIFKILRSIKILIK